MPEYIEREALLNALKKERKNGNFVFTTKWIKEIMDNLPAAGVIEVVRCKDCVFAVPLDKHCEINTSTYKHCVLLRGDETRNVWHKYKKYYKDYSIVELDEFCSEGKRKEGAEE